MKALLIALESLIFHIKNFFPPPPPPPPNKNLLFPGVGQYRKKYEKKVSIKMHFISDLKDFLIKKVLISDQRVRKVSTYPIQGCKGKCNAITVFSEENTVTQASRWI